MKSKADMAEQAEKIKDQLEFYFSESNLRKDKFLQKEISKTKDGFVGLDVLFTFNKLKALTTDAKEVSDALKDSDLVEVSKDGDKIRRSADLPADDTSKERTLYVKGYPLDDADVTIESVGDAFKEYGKVLMVRLRKDSRTKKFKGSAFVEFDKPDCVKAAVDAAYTDKEDEKKCTMCYRETPFLCVMHTTEWLMRKEAKRKR